MVAAKVGDGRKVPLIHFESVLVMTRHILPYIGLASICNLAQGQIRRFHSHFVLVLYNDSCAQRHDYTNSASVQYMHASSSGVYNYLHSIHNIWYFVKLMAYDAGITHVNIETTFCYTTFGTL